MDLFHREDLRTLALQVAAPCITITMPTERVEANMSQNPIRFKNLLKKTTEELRNQGHREEVIQASLAKARELLEREDIWRKPKNGLALFLSSSESRVYRLPIDLDELVVVGNRFHLKPLFPLISSDSRFYVLALSRNQVQLFRATQFSMEEVHDADIPKSLADALFTDMPTATIKGPMSAKARGGRQEMMYHGHGQSAGDYRSEQQEALRRYFNKIDDAVTNAIGDNDAPMLLAGVAYYLPIYREVNSYQGLIEDELVPGNWEHLTPKEIHERAWDVAAPVVRSSETGSVDRFNLLRNRGENLASTDLREIIAAAIFSRVDTLFVPLDTCQWGTYDESTNVVELHEERMPGDEDLFNLAAVHTHSNGGMVHVLPADQMPIDGGRCAAIFRYAPGAPAEMRRNGQTGRSAEPASRESDGKVASKRRSVIADR